MSTWDNSSINDIKNNLEAIRQQQTLVHIFNADNNATQIAACIQALKHCIDGFLVGNPIFTILFAIPDHLQQVETTMIIEIGVQVCWRIRSSSYVVLILRAGYP